MTKTVDGKDVTEEFQADDPVALKKQHPEIAKIYDKLAGKGIPQQQQFGATGDILVKDEGRLPTGSFKARGLVMAVSMAKELGITTMAMPTNGNAGAAMAAYCARAGMKSYIFCPDDTPEVNVREIAPDGCLPTPAGPRPGSGSAPRSSGAWPAMPR